MNKTMRELLAQIQEKTAEAKGMEDVDKASSIMDEVDALQKAYETEKRIYEAEKMSGAQGATAEVEDHVEVKEAKDSVKEFAKAVRIIAKGGTPMSETYGTDEEGEFTGSTAGYTVPEDVSTRIEHYKDVDYALESDIDVVSVKTNKGSRTYQKKTTPNIFVDIDEMGAITEEIQAPVFERVPYTIQDRAGFMPVSNDLIEDSDANIMEIVAEWLGRADVNTTNAKVLAKVAEKTPVDLKDIDGIKKALNVTLGQAYKVGAKIYTNDDGLNYLDTLKDENGRPMLNPDPTAPANMTLRCGTTVLPIKVIPNKIMPTQGGKCPFIVGNLFDYVRKYDRKRITLDASSTAQIGSFNAFAQNMTLMRAIRRDDFRVKDVDSIVNGYITLVETPADSLGE